MTQVVHVPLGDRAYDIHIGRDLMGQAGALIKPVLQRAKVAIVTDSNVAPLHLHRLKDPCKARGSRMPPLYCLPVRQLKVGRISVRQ